MSELEKRIEKYRYNQYPVIDGVTEYHKPLDALQVENIQNAILEDAYGDIIVRIDTEHIENDFESIVKQCIDEIRMNAT